MRLLGRLVLGSVALVLAVPCGALVLAAGVLLDPVSRDTVGALGLIGIIEGIDDMAAGLPPDVAIGAMVAFLRALAILLLLPPALVALIGETLRLRALAWYGGATGLLTAALPWIARGGVKPPSGQDALVAEGRVMAVLFLAGAASGLVYWMVAGRSAAEGRPAMDRSR
ncbi:hypothetical protein [Methylobacterium gnaphalii]|uniref:Uncharacterized protein n=1 Tax=Methylobacterium gnaphalii TaxID=1010610 RepID=A0A512JHZ0_9HYPH|nr:hypothetical protein [Methylobacterium gnaphalii]GEP09579.1 hypothetical protein MGN01_14240 [Methylobacterium gnaphalii]GJD67834.1 hypothetical protein MMMDOFMJ_0751 [Methylobacterium gnaphalii]GLS48123.1 hypothetical protein GCM10007885_09670 [Methylobacterium gnaphalii]